MTEVDWRLVPRARSGWAAMPWRTSPPGADQSPQHITEVAPFRIGRIPVTKAQYGALVRATGHRRPCSWPEGSVPTGRASCP